MRNIGAILVFLLVFAGANVIVDTREKARKVSPPHGAEKKAMIDSMANNKPAVVLIGNSMLGEGIDPHLLSELLGIRVEKFSRGGAASAWWYLVFKNVVLSAKVKPQCVVIFFRDLFLTKPEYRTSGKYRRSIEGMADQEEPLLDRLVFGAQGVEKYIDKLPLYQKRDTIQKQVDIIIKDIFTTKITNISVGGSQKAISRTFDEKKLDPIQLNLEQIKAEQIKATAKTIKFKSQLKRSFLPDIVNRASASGINLVFVRIKRKRDLTPNNEPEVIKQYVAELKKYFADNKIPFIDFTYDQRIVKSHYAVGDHMDRKKGRPFLTKLLAQELKPILFLENIL
ncbi:MAG: hypothetical protein D3910_14020 [Candidatus Electrothrix sp. ATG2]|nr:hypothetical protein [Candidatus Electrothrix sp. ATG2]